LREGQIVTDAADAESALCELIAMMREPADEVVSLYYGSGISRAAAAAVRNLLEQQFDGLQVELYHGGQPHYQYIVSIE
jgi:dihydroxyacetone kinase-like predicted kinase